jgi:hypothetical protein
MTGKDSLAPSANSYVRNGNQTHSAGSRILAEQRLREEAQRLDAEGHELGKDVDDGVTILFADLVERRRGMADRASSRSSTLAK